ncbi:High affinity cAMP-specific and IBMX-insensitive 3',5'-cyclic phosphodiesterase 9A [Chytridiales sp. JEL 0842]|nr:High affinity cAMP-specific and IBMX-insensitive 3',5'-cyclic phosphodiesterase 9A [Chytridiales sp. JEL 0842]
MAKSGYTRVHIKINDQTHIVEFSQECSQEEVYSLFLSAADLPDDPEVPVVLKLKDSKGCILPIGPGLQGNASSEPESIYTLEVQSEKQIELAAIQSTLDEIITSSTQVSPEDVQELYKSVNLLKAKLEGMDKGTPSKPPAKKQHKIDPRYIDKPKYVLTEETKAYLKSPSFDNWQWEDNEIIGLMEHIFEDLGLMEEYKIEVPTLRRFLMNIRTCYNQNPFHNFRHCFCVTQMMYGIINTTNVVQQLKPIDKLILVLACIGHDLDHPGYNNAYQINAGTDLAYLYNDISPLENHHACVLFTILSDPETNVLKNVSDPVYRDARKGIIRCILATDMAKHGEIIAAFKKLSENFNYEDPESKSLLLQMIIKCADISNEEPWVEALLDEFFGQSDREKAEGLPTAPFMDREKVTKASAQVGFIGYVMIPLYETLAKVLPNMEESVIRPIRESLVYYKEMQAKEAGKA